MSQMDNRNSSASKRARTDGSCREDDWTCSSCGNVNFSFRTTCNKKNCSQSRPAAKSAAKSMQGPQGYSASSPFPGSAVPPSMYFGMPPYGSSLFNGAHVPPYDVASSGFHYNYGSRLAAGGLYRPARFSAPYGPYPFSGGSMMGGMYSIPPIMECYGMGMPLTPSATGARPFFFPEDVQRQKDSTLDDDWTCPNCGNVNFSFRTICNMKKCNAARPGSQAAETENSSKQQQMPDGSWKCDKCNNINYPFRMKCNRQNCGADKPSDSNRSASPAPEDNDQ